MYLLGNSNQKVNIKERSRRLIIRSCSRREDGWGLGSHLMQSKRKLKARNSGINQEAWPWKSGQADRLHRTCLGRTAGAHRRMRQVPGPQGLGRGISKECCSPVQTLAPGFLPTEVRVVLGRGSISRGHLAPASNEIQLSLWCCLIQLKFDPEMMSWHFILVYLLAGLPLNVWPWLNGAWGSFSPSSSYP